MEEVRELDELFREAHERGYRCEATWSQDRLECMDLIFGRNAMPAVQARGNYRETYWTNYPRMDRLRHALSSHLKQHLAHALADYMVPGSFVVLESLPLTPNGKVDRQALPAPVEEDFQKEVYVAPRNDVEQALCAVMEDILGLRRVGIRDDFFDLGGHSLTATRLVARVRLQFGKDLPLRVIFEGRTVERLAAVVKGEASAATEVRLLARKDTVLTHISIQLEWLAGLHRIQHGPVRAQHDRADGCSL